APAPRGAPRRRPARAGAGSGEPDPVPGAWRGRPAGVHAVRPAGTRPAARPHRRLHARLACGGVRGGEGGRRREAVGAPGARAVGRVDADPPGRTGATPDPDGERHERRATGNPAVSPRRPVEAGHRDPGSATHRESPPRAPMTARVSFPDRAKRTGAAVAWIASFGVAGGASGWAVSRIGPEPGPAWSLAWSSLSGAVGFALATWLGAIGFGLAHLGNPSATAFSTVNVALAGVWLACAFFSPGAMPLAWGAHFGWNATLALGFEAPVSGYVFPQPAIAYRAGAHGWIDGGAFGPEGGIVT